MENITHQKLIELGFNHSWNTDSFSMFFQGKGYNSKTRHHVLLDKSDNTYWFRGRGHTICKFDSIYELKELMGKYMNKQ